MAHPKAPAPTRAETAAPQLEAPAVPPQPVPLMSDTPKKRADLAAVSRMLREGQEGAGDETDEDEEDDAPAVPAPSVAEDLEGRLPDAGGFGAPDWFRMPSNGFPGDVAPGSTVIFLRFPVSVTGNVAKGERQCACRPLTVKLEKFARAKAANGTGYDVIVEMTRAMICVVDGSQAEFFAKGGGSVNAFWQEIGPKARELLFAIYNKLNRLEAKERDAFLATCVAVRTVG